MIFEFLPDARSEFIQAALDYQEKQIGLGTRFRNEVASVIERILFDPFLWRERAGGYRRVNLPIFPYYIAYMVRAEKVIVLAVAHTKRKPAYWKSRTRTVSRS